MFMSNGSDEGERVMIPGQRDQSSHEQVDSCDPRRIRSQLFGIRVDPLRVERQAAQMILIVWGLAMIAVLLSSCSTRGAEQAPATPHLQRFDVSCPAGTRTKIVQRENLPPLVTCADTTASRRDSMKTAARPAT
jgi:hypothetical protein